MKKVITYGTYDLFHFGHENLLRGAKALGDYLIVGVTSDNFDKARGKLLVQQPLTERIAAVRATDLADEIIVEEYEGQKIDDIKKHGVDIFTVGSDWEGKFDYLSEYCEVVYLPRTEGVSSTELRDQAGLLRLGIVGYNSAYFEKFLNEVRYISGAEVTNFYFQSEDASIPGNLQGLYRPQSYGDFLNQVDAVYIYTNPKERPVYIRKALERGKHVLCETPIAMDEKETCALYQEAEHRGLVLFEMLKTAYSLAFQRLILLLKGGTVGKIKCVEATCTSLEGRAVWRNDLEQGGGAMVSWGPYALLPAMKILGLSPRIYSFSVYRNEKDGTDLYARMLLGYETAEAILKVGTGVKSEGDMVISGTNGYVYVPSPWWKMDYFEVRKEDSRKNKRYFYQFEGEGLRYALAEFIRSIRGQNDSCQLSPEESAFVSRMIRQFRQNENVTSI